MFGVVILENLATKVRNSVFYFNQKKSAIMICRGDYDKCVSSIIHPKW